MNPLLLMSGMSLAKLIRNKEVSSLEIVQTHIAHLQKVNKHINAVVQTRFDQAIEDAKRADGFLKSYGAENCPVFHGVPCTIKESFKLIGMPNTGGLVARKGIISDEDATAVSRLRNAGVIPLGVTNLSELGMWMESFNHVYGKTNNAYDSKRTSGGSSGGEGAIIGSGASPFGLGSDIGGSIRMPAFFNGVFGHKSTSGLIPNTGQFPNVSDSISVYVSTGPLARHSEDLFPLLTLLSGPDSMDGACKNIPLGDPNSINISELSIIDIQDNSRITVSKELQDVQIQVANRFRDMGVHVKRESIPELKYSFEMWFSMIDEATHIPFSQTFDN